MGGYLVVIGLALVAAIGVIVLANAAGDGGTDVRTFWADLRSGLRRRRRAGTAEESPVVDEVEPVDVPFDQLFAEASQPDDGYLQLDELAEMLERTGERAVRLREHLPYPRAGAAGPAERVVVQDRVPAPAPGAVAPAERAAAAERSAAAPHPAAAPARAPRVPRRSGHVPVRTVAGAAAPSRPAAAAAAAGPTATPPSVPPQRGDA
jgi:pyruvate/2-oxoglutarate dehydrogenase complex dihydrolipoamide acyltransferase (E2) component